MSFLPSYYISNRVSQVIPAPVWRERRYIPRRAYLTTPDSETVPGSTTARPLTASCTCYAPGAADKTCPRARFSDHMLAEAHQDRIKSRWMLLLDYASDTTSILRIE